MLMSKPSNDGNEIQEEKKDTMFYKNKNVLVTGGTGFIGIHFVQKLLNQGAHVRIPLHQRPLLLKDNKIETIQADLTRPEDCLRAVAGVDYIFHAAGAVAAAAVRCVPYDAPQRTLRPARAASELPADPLDDHP
jgi:uncharacterized protein YbjT (DUF2867 family)